MSRHRKDQLYGMKRIAMVTRTVIAIRSKSVLLILFGSSFTTIIAHSLKKMHGSGGGGSPNHSGGWLVVQRTTPMLSQA